eukprot:3122303-Pyramimonas_sp.AAC.2
MAKTYDWTTVPRHVRLLGLNSCMRTSELLFHPLFVYVSKYYTYNIDIILLSGVLSASLPLLAQEDP